MKGNAFTAVGFLVGILAALVVAPMVVLWALSTLGVPVRVGWESVAAVDVLYFACWLLLTHAFGYTMRESLNTSKTARELVVASTEALKAAKAAGKGGLN